MARKPDIKGVKGEGLAYVETGSSPPPPLQFTADRSGQYLVAVRLRFIRSAFR